MKRFRYRFKETIVTVLVDEEKYYKIAVESIHEARREIEATIREEPLFLNSLEPLDFYTGDVTRRMCDASKKAKVGPMASVAGMIAQFCVENMVEEGAQLAVVDNGGDIAIFTDRELVVGIYSGTEIRIGFKIKPSSEIMAICTSSGKIGHSISFGFADATTVFGSDACVADAFATALGNEIKDSYGKKELEEVLSSFWKRACKYNHGIFAVKDEFLGFAGKIPEITRAEINPDLITRG
ncbi:MAG TPA: UPF0280 family protein [Archaeoglobaceae archaeon]|nr:UPF0280 family protein [Archaeoglobaceae archaeon]